MIFMSEKCLDEKSIFQDRTLSLGKITTIANNEREKEEIKEISKERKLPVEDNPNSETQISTRSIPFKFFDIDSFDIEMWPIGQRRPEREKSVLTKNMNTLNEYLLRRFLTEKWLLRYNSDHYKTAMLGMLKRKRYSPTLFTNRSGRQTKKVILIN